MGQLITGEYGVIEKNGKPVVSSRYIASNFSKQHSHVLRDIQTAVENFSQIGQSRFGESNFIKSTYKNEQNKKQPEYLLTYDGFSYIVMGFTGKKASEFNFLVKALQRIDIGLVHAVTDFQQRKSMLEQQYMRLSQRLLKSA